MRARCRRVPIGLMVLTAFAVAGGGPERAEAQEQAQAQEKAQEKAQESTPRRDWLDGYVSVSTDFLPNVGDTLELRTRLFVERRIDASPNVRFFLSGWAEGLIADRAGGFRPGLSGATGAGIDRSHVVRDAVAQPHEAYVDVRAGALDLRAGMFTIVWGRLDEVQPSDVVNPLDISRYLFEGRSAARLPVPLVRARWVSSEALAIEGVWVPFFRRARFDLMDEDSSPFNLLTDRDLCARGGPCPPLPVEIEVERRDPARTLGNSQGGVRVSATSGQVDWSVSGYRGFEPYGVVSIDPRPPFPQLIQTYPRYTMIAGDVETVRGAWALRGEAAAFLDTTFQSADGSIAGDGHAIEGGGSVERRAGDYRINAAVLVERRVTDAFTSTDISLVTGAQRSFARDTRRVLLFGLWNMADDSGFLRSIGSWSLRDNLWVEGSVGWFLGEGTDTLSRFAARDFVSVKLKAYF